MAAHGVEKTPTEIDKALAVLAYHGGNASRAGEELGISRSTLHLWKTSTHRDRYLEIAEREGPKLEAIAAHQARALILRAGEAEHSLLSLLEDRIDEGAAPKELGEISGALQRVTTSKGINGTKLLELTGRPTSIVEHRDPRTEGLALLRDLGITIESTAETIESVPLLNGSEQANAREAAFVAQSQTPASD